MRRREKQVTCAVSDVGAEFADVQKYLNELDLLDEDTKAVLITLCMTCNDSRARAIETTRRKALRNGHQRR